MQGVDSTVCSAGAHLNLHDEAQKHAKSASVGFFSTRGVRS